MITVLKSNKGHNSIKSEIWILCDVAQYFYHDLLNVKNHFEVVTIPVLNINKGHSSIKNGNRVMILVFCVSSDNDSDLY